MPARESGGLDRRFGRWPAGVNQVDELRDLQAREVPAVRGAVNVDFSPDGRPHRRRGYAPIRAGSPAHSLWSPREAECGFLVQDGVFYRLTSSEMLEPLVSVGAGRQKLAYAELSGRIFVSGPKARFQVGLSGPASSWGVEAPAGLPTLTPDADGALDAGRYQIAITYLTASGEESGTGAAGTVDIVAGGGILLTNIPQPSAANVVAIRPYMTTANGNELVAARSFPVGTTSLVLGRHSLQEAGKALDTQHMQRVPFCRLLLAYKGRLYFVPAQGDGTRLYYTEPLRYGLYRPHLNYLPLPDPIEDAAAVPGGIYVGTGRQTFYFGGDDPKSMARVPVSPHGMVRHTAIVVRGQIFGSDAAADEVAVWWSTSGELIRASGGSSLVTLTRGRLALPRYAEGATLAREFDGLSQIVSSLRGADESSSFGARDRAVAKVFRNGISI